MKRKGIQQKGERRIAAALRLLLVAVLLLAQILFVVLISVFLREHAAVLYTVIELAAVSCALHIYNKPGDPSYRIAWIILLLFLPVTGFILYGLWGGEIFRSRSAGQKKNYQEPQSMQTISELNAEKLHKSFPNWTRLSTYLRSRGFTVYPNTETVYFPEGKLLLEDILRTIRQAEHFVFLEYFILAEGEIWDRLFALLREKAAHGVEVCIIFDDFGNIKRFSGETLDAVRAAGIDVIVFNPVHEYVNRLYFNYRDHRKIAVIDGNIAYTGGANVADEYANIIERCGYWKDGGVRLAGDGAWGLTRCFLQMWSDLGGALRGEFDYYRPHLAKQADGFVQSFSDGPENNPDDPAEAVYLQIINGARHSLYITTPYFIPTGEIVHALCVAGDGGVDVRLMLPGIPDHKCSDMLAESYFGELIRHNVKVYRYTPGMLHLKSAVADGEVAFIGSVNMDYRSLELHFECGTVLYGTSAIRDLSEDLETVLSQSREITMEEWGKRGILRRFFAPILRPFAIWM